MRDFIDIGAAPVMEDCAQVGRDDYWHRAKRESKAYIALLRRTLGPETDGARLSVRSNPHDFGTYLSVICHFDTTLPASQDYAFRCESEGPKCWDELARRELGLSVQERS